MDEEEIKIKMDDGVDTSVASGGIALFVAGLVEGAALSLGPRMT